MLMMSSVESTTPYERTLENAPATGASGDDGRGKAYEQRSNGRGQDDADAASERVEAPDGPRANRGLLGATYIQFKLERT